MRAPLVLLCSLAVLSSACVSAPGAAVAPETLGGQGSLAQRAGATFSIRGRFFSQGPTAVSLSIGTDVVEVVQLPPSVNRSFAFATLLAPGDAYTVRTGDATCQFRHGTGVVQEADIDDVTIRCGSSFKLTSGMAASVALGQPDMTSSTPGTTALLLNRPEGVIRQQPSYVQVADANNNRIVVYTLTAGNNLLTPPGQVYGQPDFTSGAPGIGAGVYNGPAGLVSDGASLYLADRGNNRVLLYAPLPNSGTQPANFVLGQPDFTSKAPGCGAVSMNQPRAVFNVNGHLFVADTGNHRVLIWNTAITAVNQPPDLVLGQPDFTHCTLQATSATSLASPSGVWSDGQYVVVTDTDNNRVLLWTDFPTASGQPADLVLGQPDMTQNALGTSSTSLSAPTGVLCSNVRLFVADTGNRRVLGWGTLPAESSMPATLVLGQADFTSSAAAVSATGLTAPVGLADVGSNLLVSDRDSNRVMIYVSAP